MSVYEKVFDLYHEKVAKCHPTNFLYIDEDSFLNLKKEIDAFLKFFTPEATKQYFNGMEIIIVDTDKEHINIG